MRGGRGREEKGGGIEMSCGWVYGVLSHRVLLVGIREC